MNLPYLLASEKSTRNGQMTRPYPLQAQRKQENLLGNEELSYFLVRDWFRRENKNLLLVSD
jgi:hypothetical protein